MGFKLRFKKRPNDFDPNEQSVNFIRKSIEFMAKKDDKYIEIMRESVIPAIGDGCRKAAKECRAKGLEPPSIEEQYQAFMKSKHWPQIFEKLLLTEKEVRRIIEENLR